MRQHRLQLVSADDKLQACTNWSVHIRLHVCSTRRLCGYVAYTHCAMPCRAVRTASCGHAGSMAPLKAPLTPVMLGKLLQIQAKQRHSRTACLARAWLQVALHDRWHACIYMAAFTEGFSMMHTVVLDLHAFNNCLWLHGVGCKATTAAVCTATAVPSTRDGAKANSHSRNGRGSMVRAVNGCLSCHGDALLVHAWRACAHMARVCCASRAARAQAAH